MINQELLAKFDMINGLIPIPHIIVGGQPSLSDLKMLAQAGVTNVVNLRPLNETIAYDEASEVARLGMKYHLIPVSEIESFTRESALALQRILALRQPCLVHCASGNRVGALIALAAYWLEGLSAEEAMELGLQAGLTKLQPQIADLLALEVER